MPIWHTLRLRMLHLCQPSDPAWGTRAVLHLDEILLDHAHLERKAAGNAVSILFKYSHIEALALPLSELAREELAHFELVVEHLRARKLAYRPLKPAPYPGRLRQLQRKKEPEQLLDLLLCSALIEARSCERMQLLAGALGDAPLAALYKGLLRAEARHHALFVDLAASLFPHAAPLRLEELSVAESEIIATAPTVPRLHNNCT